MSQFVCIGLRLCVFIEHRAILICLSLSAQLTRFYWYLGPLACDLWISCDVIGSTSSIFNLVAISVDRFYAVKFPIKYAQRAHSNHIMIIIGVCWAVSGAVGVPIFAGLNQPPQGFERPEFDCAFYNSDYILYSGIISFWAPTVVICVLYWRIYKALRQRSRAHKAQLAARKAVADRNTLAPPTTNNTTTSSGEARRRSTMQIMLKPIQSIAESGSGYSSSGSAHDSLSDAEANRSLRRKVSRPISTGFDPAELRRR